MDALDRDTFSPLCLRDVLRTEMLVGVEASDTVVQSWQTIRRWFEQHAPDQLAAFRGPCAEDDLHAVEQATGRPLPGDQQAWWRLTDGTDGLLAPRLIPVVWIPLSTQAALREYRLMCKIGSRESELAQHMSEPAGTPCSGVWLPHWLPIAHDLGGDFLFLDLRPGPRCGCVGQHLKDEWRYDGPVWPSVTAMLSVVADALTNGTKVGNRRAAIEGGRISWPLDPEYLEAVRRHGSINP